MIRSRHYAVFGERLPSELMTALDDLEIALDLYQGLKTRFVDLNYFPTDSETSIPRASASRSK